MTLYNRRMFTNVPEKMKINSRGTGITSGLVPIKPIKMEKGGSVYDRLYEIYSDAIPQEKGFFSQNAPALLNFFSALAQQGAGGQPATGQQQSPFISTLGAIAQAAPALGDIKPYTDQAKLLAAEKAAEFEVDAELEALTKDAPELKNTKIIQREVEVAAPTEEDPSATKTEVHNFLVGTIGNDVYEQDLGVGVPDIQGTSKVVKIEDGKRINYLVGFKNGKAFETRLGEAPDEISNFDVTEENGKRIARFFKNGQLQPDLVLGDADKFFQSLGTETVDAVQDDGSTKRVQRYSYLIGSTADDATLKFIDVGETSDSVSVAQEKVNEQKEAINSAWQAFRNKYGHEALPDLDQTQINRAYMAVGDDKWGTVTDKGFFVDALEAFFQNTLLGEFDKEAVADATGDGIVTDQSSGKKQIVDAKFDPNIIAFYNLNPNQPNFSSIYDDFAEKYQDNMIDQEEADGILKGVNSIKALAAIKDVSSGTIAGLGESGIIQYLATSFGLAPTTNVEEFVEFITRQQLLDLEAVDLLIKGVPSNIDLRKVELLTPSAADRESTVLKKLQILDEFFTATILDKIKFAAGSGTPIPSNVLNDAKEILGKDLVNEALGTKWTEERVSDFRTMSSDEYRKKYGDPFNRSISLLNQDIETYQRKDAGDLTEDEDEAIKELFQEGLL